MKAWKHSKSIEDLSIGVLDLTEQISRRKKLHNEFNVAAIKVSRSNVAQNLLRGVEFCNCPQCGQQLNEIVEVMSSCHLCKQPTSEELKANDVEILQADLKTRQIELKDSVQKLERQLKVMESELIYMTHEKLQLDLEINDLEREYDSAYLAIARDIERHIGLLEGRKRELLNLLPLPQKIEQLYKEVGVLASEEEKYKNELNVARRNAEMDVSNLEELKVLFLENLTIVGFPGIKKGDYVEISTTDFIPRIMRFGENELYTTEFANLGSGGKKTIFKCCYILAIHRLIARRQIQIPKFLLIDTPMKNISERENRDIFEGFYKLIYQLYANELSDHQLIIVDKEFFSPEETDFEEYFADKNHLVHSHMTPDDSEAPPLIKYYRGH